MNICWYVVPMCVVGMCVISHTYFLLCMMYVEKLMVCMFVSILFVYIMDNIIVL